MENINLSPPLDLMEVRRQLIAVRSQHSDDRQVTRVINNLIRKLAHLHAAENRRHEESLSRIIAKTVQRIEQILAARSSDERSMSEAEQH
jgi:hypothetical protein